MLSESQAKKVIDAAVEYAGKKVDGIEVSIAGTDVATSRFANNQMTQNQSPGVDRVSLRILKGERQIRLSTDDLSRDGVAGLIDTAVTAVEYVATDKELLPLFEAEQNGSFEHDAPKSVNRFDSRAARMTAEARARAVNSIIAQAKDAGLDSAGVVASGSKYSALGNSTGLFVYHKETHVECSVTMVAEDSTGWAKMVSPYSKSVDPAGLGATALSKARLSANPKEIEPGSYEAILEPSAVLDLLGFILWDFAGTSHIDRRSCLLDMVGQKVFGDNITIYDDVYHRDQAGPTFDGEGMTRQAIPIIEGGVLKNLIYGRGSASQVGLPPTGHGLSVPSNMGEYAMNPVLHGGKSSLPEMIASTEKGILLSRVWYVRDVDPARKILTGMTRDGTFMIEHGEIAYGVKNLRFNISLKDLLNNVIALSPTERAAGEETSPAVVPAMKVEGFKFTETTRF